MKVLRMRFLGLVLLSVCLLMGLSACGNKAEKSEPVKDTDVTVVEEDDEYIDEEPVETKEPKEVVDEPVTPKDFQVGHLVLTCDSSWKSSDEYYGLYLSSNDMEMDISILDSSDMDSKSPNEYIEDFLSYNSGSTGPINDDGILIPCLQGVDHKSISGVNATIIYYVFFRIESEYVSRDVFDNDPTLDEYQPELEQSIDMERIFVEIPYKNNVYEVDIRSWTTFEEVMKIIDSMRLQ